MFEKLIWHRISLSIMASLAHPTFSVETEQATLMCDV